MTRYIVWRLLQMIPVLLGVSVIVFLLVRLIPGDPATAVLGSRATPELIRQARAQLHLNEPLWKQYLDFLAGAVHGNFGVSYFYESSVWSITVPRIPVTLELIAYAGVLALLITFPVSVVAAAKRGRSSTSTSRSGSSTSTSSPARCTATSASPTSTSRACGRSPCRASPSRSS